MGLPSTLMVSLSTTFTSALKGSLKLNQSIQDSAESTASLEVVSSVENETNKDFHDGNEGVSISTTINSNSYYGIVSSGGGRFIVRRRIRSVRHRVLVDGLQSRVSMIYFRGPPHGERLAPLSLLLWEGEESRYREFTWCEYQTCVCNNMLAHNKLERFMK
ncbi:hypothetical protein Cni_G22129 [Canna indica]|uniref:Uncharacterized protein n=1 Tax=Canna indica TaxID=4628 RepID=A0AAQ3KRC2_9LILI|nr:hypothetical protein Cni_G22129 [Canna indica]